MRSDVSHAGLAHADITAQAKLRSAEISYLGNLLYDYIRFAEHQTIHAIRIIPLV